MVKFKLLIGLVAAVALLTGTSLTPDRTEAATFTVPAGLNPNDFDLVFAKEGFKQKKLKSKPWGKSKPFVYLDLLGEPNPGLRWEGNPLKPGDVLTIPKLDVVEKEQPGYLSAFYCWTLDGTCLGERLTYVYVNCVDPKQRSSGASCPAPVPLPATGIMVIAGLLGLGLAARRRPQ